MPEVKRLFVGARLDKDSDERFVQPGHYTDAVNVEIITSEGGDAGVVRNKLGTTRRANATYNASTGTYTVWASDLGLVNATCIGVHKHTPTNTIYMFITSDGVDVIAQFNDDTNLTIPVLVDTNGILNFSGLITGIQLIEGVLGWTQEDEEPRAIVVSEWIEGSTDFVTTTQRNGGDFVFSDITMMRLSPLSKANMALSDTLRDGIIESTTLKNFTIAQLNDGSLSPPVAVGTSTTFELPTGSALVVGDKVKLTAAAAGTDILTVKYEINMVITNTWTSGKTIAARVISASDTVEDKVIAWEVVLIQAKPLFELVFPRFSYRWKYSDNQYSTFAPFTEVAFLADTYLYNSQKGYNTGMTNNVRKVTLDGFATAPGDVVEIDILYKASHSPAVYVVDTIKVEETEYILTDELIHKLVDSNQLLRPWDAVPKSALALEAVGNRFVLGNYKRNYDVPDQIEFSSALVASTEVAEVTEPEESVKSLRTYQAGVVYKDRLGRESSVFSDKTGVVQTTLEDAITANKLSFQLRGDAPEWATHFKYFVKDTANEYYNLAADRLYQSEDKLATWISFPSSERNKVTVDSYLIAKKLHDKDSPVMADDNKFKIIDIQSEAPTEIATKKEKVIESVIWFDSNFGDGNGQTTKNVGSTPVPNSKVFLIASDKELSSDGITSVLLDQLKEGAYIQFKAGDARSKYYKIANISYSGGTYVTTFSGIAGSSGTHAQVYVTEAFKEDVNFLYTDPELTASPLRNNRVTLAVYAQQELANQEQFTGRFFAKLASNAVLNAVFATSEQYVTLNAANCYDGGYINNDINFKIHAGGNYPRLGYSVSNTSGGLNVDRNPSWANDDVNDTIYDIVFEKKHRNPIDNDLVAAINSIGTKIRFSNHSTIYTVVSSRSQFLNYRDNDYTRYWTEFDKRLTTDVSPHVTGENVTVEVVGLEDVAAFTSKNPAIFETEPLEGVDLNFYYEASDAFPISEYNDIKTLDYFNCFTFGNGVESNRIRDDYNAVTIDKGPKVSSVLDEPYGEEHVAGGLIWSGIFNSHSAVNNLNQFVIAEKITKEISPIYGSIQYLHARDTDLVILCEDKILQALADKDALYNADGSSNITASNAVIGNVRPFVGEFGVSTDRASFASYGFRAYFTDKKRGVVCRLSRDGITPIVEGYENELETQFKSAGTIIGNFDDETGKYNVTMNGITHQFSEEVSGWTGTWEVGPEMGITLNNTYYTVKNGVLHAHDDAVNRNSWYGNAAVDSSVTFVFNDEPSAIKKFKTLSYEGEDGWVASVIETDQQSGRVLTWEEREGKFYNHIKGLPTDWDNLLQTGSLDTKEFSVQGIGNLISLGGDILPSTFTINIFDDPADH